MKGWKLFTPLLILAIVAITLYLRLHNPPLLLQGEADATNVIVSSKAKGRVQVLHVRRGDEVKQGDLLISLDSPELEAQLDALHAARNQAQAQLDESLHGTREESIRALKASLAQAEAELRNAESDFQRNQQMVERGFLSRTQFDLSRRERDVARDRVAEARANLDEGLKGDREERRQALQAAVRRADAQIAELQAQIDDLQVRAPVNGEVGPIPAEQGELINAYSPLLTLVRLDDSYFVFNLREDILAKVRKGDRIVMQVPGLGGAEVETELRYIAPLGDFSTRRATRATGDFDLKTFETRFYPLPVAADTRPAPGHERAVALDELSDGVGRAEAQRQPFRPGVQHRDADRLPQLDHPLARLVLAAAAVRRDQRRLPGRYPAGHAAGGGRQGP